MLPRKPLASLFFLLALSFPVRLFAETSFIYDDLDRLVRATYSDGAYIAYEYDDVGNRKQGLYYSPAVPGDVNGSGTVELTDVILSLQVAAGMNVTADMESDVDGDGRIGLEEAVYGLRFISAN